MITYEQVYKAYQDAHKNYFWDMWGIVLSPRNVHQLEVECLSKTTVHNVGGYGIEKLFGLVIIPCVLVEDDKAYIVDETLGRKILGWWQSKQTDCAWK